MCFRKGEKQQGSLHVGVADRFEEQRYTSLTGAARVNTRLTGNECRTVMEERDRLGKSLRNFTGFYSKKTRKY